MHVTVVMTSLGLCAACVRPRTLMSAFWFTWRLLRSVVCKLLMTFFGYLFPALCSTKAIVQKDEDGLHEWTTYWVVFALLGVVDNSAGILLSRWALYEEAKILIVIWLAHPRFQGAFRIHTLILQPYFEMYESEIDTHITIVQSKATAQLHKTARAVMYSLFFDSQENFLSHAARQMAGSASPEVAAIAGFTGLAMGATNFLKPAGEPPAPAEKRIISEFKSMLSTGLYLKAMSSNSKWCVSLVKLTHGRILTLSGDSPTALNLSVPLWRVLSVSPADRPSHTVEIELDGLAGFTQTPLLLHAETEDEAVALLAGLQMMKAAFDSHVGKRWRKVEAILIRGRTRQAMGMWSTSTIVPTSTAFSEMGEDNSEDETYVEDFEDYTNNSSHPSHHHQPSDWDEVDVTELS